MRLLSDAYVDLSVADAGNMRVHLFRPLGDGRFPALIFYSEIYQVTGPVRRLAALLAGHGFLVAVPEVYHEYEPSGTVFPYDAGGTERGNLLKATKPLTAFDADTLACLDYLTAHPLSSGFVGTIGMCLGGHLALRAALSQAVSAAVCFYPTDLQGGILAEGRGSDTLERLDTLQAECLFVWGRQDPHIPADARELIRTRINAAGVCYEWMEFNAAHAFMRDEGPRYDPVLSLRSIAAAVELFQRRATEKRVMLA